MPNHILTGPTEIHSFLEHLPQVPPSIFLTGAAFKATRLETEEQMGSVTVRLTDDRGSLLGSFRSPADIFQ